MLHAKYNAPTASNKLNGQSTKITQITNIQSQSKTFGMEILDHLARTHQYHGHGLETQKMDTSFQVTKKIQNPRGYCDLFQANDPNAA